MKSDHVRESIVSITQDLIRIRIALDKNDKDLMLHYYEDLVSEITLLKENIEND